MKPEYTVTTAYTATEARDSIHADTDIVLLDRRLPDGSGDEVLQTIRNRGYDCRVAMITAVEPDFDILDLGFDEYLTKPVEQDDLKTTVETLLNRCEYADKLQRYAALISKQASLAEAHSEAALATNDDYADLQEEIATLRSELAERRDEFEVADFESLFLTLEPETTESDRREATDEQISAAHHTTDDPDSDTDPPSVSDQNDTPQTEESPSNTDE